MYQKDKPFIDATIKVLEVTSMRASPQVTATTKKLPHLIQDPTQASGEGSSIIPFSSSWRGLGPVSFTFSAQGRSSQASLGFWGHGDSYSSTLKES
ncbi:hypothetical protein C1H46_029604 [Malus baccata]|uniref:Uncharacterized protein n=1 Tax=Malus baccata TaxID=106549 RepID=A0A540LEC7_MALBA|nr:hypothetical protein C1H46_029604 [Malus baccata]